jgi:hypothetical protein
MIMTTTLYLMARNGFLYEAKNNKDGLFNLLHSFILLFFYSYIACIDPFSPSPPTTNVLYGYAFRSIRHRRLQKMENSLFVCGGRGKKGG